MMVGLIRSGVPASFFCPLYFCLIRRKLDWPRSACRREHRQVIIADVLSRLPSGPAAMLARLSFLAVACLAVLSPIAHAGKYNRVLDIGSQAPAWKELPGVDGKEHSLADLKD